MGDIFKYYNNIINRNIAETNKKFMKTIFKLSQFEEYVTQEEKKGKENMTKLEELIQRRDQLNVTIETLQKNITEEPENNSVIYFEKYFGGLTKYTYCAINVGGWWYCTGKRDVGRDWEGLWEFIHFKEIEVPKIWIVSEWEEL